MTRYQNGRVPDSALVTLDSAANHCTSPKGAAMWYALRRNVQADHGITLHITPGWNAYRPYAEQEKGRKNACAQGNCNAAAVPGWSSHGGTWWDWRKKRWIDALAFDIGDWSQLTKAEFYRQARRVGFEPGLITPAVAGVDEVWHIILEDPWGAVPAGLDAHPARQESTIRRRDKDMPIFSVIPAALRPDKKNFYFLTGDSGVIVQWVGEAYANAIEQQVGAPAAPCTQAVYDQITARFKQQNINVVNADEIGSTLNVNVSKG